MIRDPQNVSPVDPAYRDPESVSTVNKAYEERYVPMATANLPRSSRPGFFDRSNEMRNIVIAAVTAAVLCPPIPAIAQGLHFGWERRSWDNPGLSIAFDKWRDTASKRNGGACYTPHCYHSHAHSSPYYYDGGYAPLSRAYSRDPSTRTAARHKPDSSGWASVTLGSDDRRWRRRDNPDWTRRGTWTGLWDSR